MKAKNISRRELLNRRHKRVLRRVREGNHNIRLRVTKTNSHVYVQALNDLEQRTVASSSSLSLKLKNGNRENCVNIAKDICKKLKNLNIDKVSVDRGGHSYHGKIATIVEVLREEGIKV